MSSTANPMSCPSCAPAPHVGLAQTAQSAGRHPSPSVWEARPCPLLKACLGFRSLLPTGLQAMLLSCQLSLPPSMTCPDPSLKHSHLWLFPAAPNLPVCFRLVPLSPHLLVKHQSQAPSQAPGTVPQLLGPLPSHAPGLAPACPPQPLSSQ